MSWSTDTSGFGFIFLALLLPLLACKLYVQRRCVWLLTGLIALASCCISMLAIVVISVVHSDTRFWCIL